MLVAVTVRKLSIQLIGVLRKPLPSLMWLLSAIMGPLTVEVSLYLVIWVVRLMALCVVLRIRGV